MSLKESRIVGNLEANRSINLSLLGTLTLFGWFIMICVAPDPRPLAAPDGAVRALRALIRLPEPAARAVTTIVLRAIGFGMFGILLSLALLHWPLRSSAIIILLLSPLLAIVSQRLNYGYFPTTAQIQLSFASGIFGALVGLTLRRSWSSLVALLLLAFGLFAWGTANGIADDLDAAARATGLHLLATVGDVPDGDEGFAKIMQTAFRYAEDNSHGTDAILPNQAAILALGVILGEERVAQIARRTIELDHVQEFNALRGRITIRGRHDLSRHFWVSAALVVLTDESRALTVGIGKELMDATPGGSGFSFVDMLANRAGIRFAVTATKDATSAREIQARISRGVEIADFFPDYQGLPEGITGDQFRTEFGGLGGAKTRLLNEDIGRRLETSRGLHSKPISPAKNSNEH